MERCQRVHDLRQCPVRYYAYLLHVIKFHWKIYQVVVGSPQTQPQRDQVNK